MEFFAPISEKEALYMNALTLAYVGDAVHSLYVRNGLALLADYKIDAMHRATSNVVKAETQAKLADKLFDSFTEAEQSVYLRGRNSSTHHRAKNQTAADYRKATGFEAVLGYLYLTGQTERLKYILEQQQ
ncbi:MAG: Mini-ribonuclease 3 [Clostridiales bacterium]|nr:Mini-ribonuclease 3 [Clostridiales bacterium]